MSEATVEQLFAETLRGEYEDDAPWDAVHKLRRLGTRDVFEVAAQWCVSENPLKRARGIDVLAQLGKTALHPTNTFPDESYALILNAVNQETEVRLWPREHAPQATFSAPGVRCSRQLTDEIRKFVRDCRTS